jgi:hypothetical protein
MIMNTYQIQWALREFTGTESYHKHLFPGRSPLLLTDGCAFVREHCNSWWLWDAILIYQSDKILRNVKFQKWILKRLKKDLSWELTCWEDSGRKPLITQIIEFSDFPLEEIKIWVIDNVALLPSEY